MRIGLALGSGGARGLAHVGVLDVLEAEGLRPVCVSGTSMGSIVGALYAKHLDADEVAHRLEVYSENPDFKECWAPFIEDEEFRDDKRFFSEFRRSIERKMLTFKTFTSPAQRGADKLMRPLQALLGESRIEDLPLPFASVAVDLVTGEPEVFTRGPLVEAVYASSAIPAVFPPLPLGDRLLIDGGGSYRVPIRDCRSLGANFVIAVNIPTFEKNSGGFDRGLDIIMRSDAIARNRLNDMVLELADFVISPEVGRFHWANFAAAPDIRRAGEEAARAALPQLRSALEKQRSWTHRLRGALARRLA